MDPKTAHPEDIAKMLRKPSGPFAKQFAELMHKGNIFLIDLTYETMDLKKDESILEIGFASGRSFEILFSNMNDIKATGIDYSEEMVSQAREINQDAVNSGKLNLYHGSSDNLPFGDNSFDKVYCNNVIYFWDDPSRHLEGVHRVLKPGGMFYTGIRTKETMLLMPTAQYGFTLYEEDDWVKILEQNGFRFILTNKKADPPIEVEGHVFKMVSLCIAAEKA
ncbi:MAG: class I SAM-dependent methyltransferase [Ignavibacteria bacterium]|jgi:ubiquinone/menaquinone biosynthesis C-methylase UbiE|nr:class I SAM-dependent methyltransferase [Ignavibacteria bacterium]